MVEMVTFMFFIFYHNFLIKNLLVLAMCQVLF